MKENIWIPIAFVSAVLGIPAIFASVQLFLLMRIKKRGQKVTGVVRVMKVTTRKRDGNNTNYAAEASYKFDGKTYRTRMPMETTPSFYRDGETVPVFLYPDRPRKGRVVCRREYAKFILVGGVCWALLIFLIALVIASS
ncbi:MAG: DUF3592 domain-containing protein [Planctomycetales bacterium]|nr:DUF3592 domain-containing protein [Planctomycetales bacterium]